MNSSNDAIRIVIQRKIQALTALRAETQRTFDELERDLQAQGRSANNYALGIDLAGAVLSGAAVIATKVLSGARALHTGAKTVAQVEKEIVKGAVGRNWGVGLLPQNQGVIQGTVSNIANSNGLFEPDVTDGMTVAFGKILVGSFIDMTSPSYWAKVASGTDPQMQINQAVQQTQRTKMDSLRAVDAAIQKAREMESQLNTMQNSGINMHQVA